MHDVVLDRVDELATGIDGWTQTLRDRVVITQCFLDLWDRQVQALVACRKLLEMYLLRGLWLPARGNPNDRRVLSPKPRARNRDLSPRTDQRDQVPVMPV